MIVVVCLPRLDVANVAGATTLTPKYLQFYP